MHQHQEVFQCPPQHSCDYIQGVQTHNTGVEIEHSQLLLVKVSADLKAQLQALVVQHTSKPHVKLSTTFLMGPVPPAQT